MGNIIKGRNVRLSIERPDGSYLDVPPMPEGFIDPYAPGAERALALAMSRTVKIEPVMILESNPGDDERMRERFGKQLEERVDRFFKGAILGEPYEPKAPSPWPPRLNFMA